MKISIINNYGVLHTHIISTRKWQCTTFQLAWKMKNFKNEKFYGKFRCEVMEPSWRNIQILQHIWSTKEHL